MCDCSYDKSMDIRTPRNVVLSAFYKRSFAFYTVKERMPVILTNTIDNLTRSKYDITEKYPAGSNEDLKSVIGELSKLKYEIMTNKPLRPLCSSGDDVEIYNEYIKQVAQEKGDPMHFNTIWLLTECYMYRRIREAFEQTKNLKLYDPFNQQKINSFTSGLPAMQHLSKYLLSTLSNKTSYFEEFASLIKANLWSNKADLSLSLGQVKEETGVFDVHQYDEFILCDKTEHIYKHLMSDQSSNIVDVVCDNVGIEVFSDMCLADYLITKGIAKHVRFNVKSIPWFISDVMEKDFHWTLEQLKSNSDESLSELGVRWANYVTSGIWEVYENNFWTLPFDFTYMQKVNPKLYRRLSEAKLIIFKGDLNYRKLFGERNWDPLTPVDKAIGEFHPSALAVIRTVKAEIICGLEKEGVVEKLDETDPKWMETGNYGLIQFSKVGK